MFKPAYILSVVLCLLSDYPTNINPYRQDSFLRNQPTNLQKDTPTIIVGSSNEKSEGKTVRLNSPYYNDDHNNFNSRHDQKYVEKPNVLNTNHKLHSTYQEINLNNRNYGNIDTNVRHTNFPESYSNNLIPSQNKNSWVPPEIVVSSGPDIGNQNDARGSSAWLQNTNTKSNDIQNDGNGPSVSLIIGKRRKKRDIPKHPRFSQAKTTTLRFHWGQVLRPTPPTNYWSSKLPLTSSTTSIPVTTWETSIQPDFYDTSYQDMNKVYRGTSFDIGRHSYTSEDRNDNVKLRANTNNERLGNTRFDSKFDNTGLYNRNINNDKLYNLDKKRTNPNLYKPDFDPYRPLISLPTEVNPKTIITESAFTVKKSPTTGATTNRQENMVQEFDRTNIRNPRYNIDEGIYDFIL